MANNKPSVTRMASAKIRRHSGQNRGIRHRIKKRMKNGEGSHGQCRHWRGESAPVRPGLIRILRDGERMPECRVSEHRRNGNEEGERYRASAAVLLCCRVLTRSGAQAEPGAELAGNTVREIVLEVSHDR